jgi:glycosyltransferase involved in cell wall biosynthesis
MHIAHFTNTYYPTVSGVVRSVSAFRQALAERGHNVFVFTQDAGDYKDEEPFIFRYLSLNLGLPNEFPATIPISPFMDRLIPTLKLDLIHTHHPVLLGQIAANKAEELDIPLVFTFHTRYREYSHYFPIPQETFQEFIKEAIDSWIRDYLKRCDHVIVPSKSMLNILSEVYEFNKPTTVVPTGVDLRPYQSSDRNAVRTRYPWRDDFVIISVGRLAPEKNWPTLLEAFAEVLVHHPHIRLVLIGDGPDSRKLKRLSKRLGIADHVDFLGRLPFEDVPAHLKAADLFAFTSHTETQGLVTLEAMAAGLPVVAVDAAGTHDVVEHEVSGLLTEDNSHAMAAAIKRMLDDPEVLDFFQRASLKRSSELEIGKQAERLIDVYQEVLEAKKGSQIHLAV